MQKYIPAILSAWIYCRARNELDEELEMAGRYLDFKGASLSALSFQICKWLILAPKTVAGKS
jgi:hypothetical protein